MVAVIVPFVCNVCEDSFLIPVKETQNPQSSFFANMRSKVQPELQLSEWDKLSGYSPKLVQMCYFPSAAASKVCLTLNIFFS